MHGRGARAPLPCARAWRATTTGAPGRTASRHAVSTSLWGGHRALSQNGDCTLSHFRWKKKAEKRGKETSKDVGKGNAAAGTCAVEHSGSLLIGSSAPLGTGPAPPPRTPAAARRWGAEWRFSLFPMASNTLRFRVGGSEVAPSHPSPLPFRPRTVTEAPPPAQRCRCPEVRSPALAVGKSVTGRWPVWGQRQGLRVWDRVTANQTSVLPPTGAPAAGPSPAPARHSRQPHVPARDL